MTTSKALRLGVAIRIDAAQCVGCAICADVCPSDALRMGPEDLLPAWGAERCSVCGDCVRECPTGAVRLARRRHYQAGTTSLWNGPTS